MLLVGRNPWGTEFAVYRFLYLYGGVRWYMPTEVGEHVPAKPTFSVPSMDRTETPAWLSRLWSAADRADKGHLQGEYMRYSRQRGVKGWYAEIYCNWALDGPKAWLASQLLWDADQKVEDLLDDFYTNFFGPAKEPLLKPVIPFDSRARSATLSASPGLLWRVLAWCRAHNGHDLAQELITKLSTPDPNAEMAVIATALWEYRPGGQKNLLANGGFEAASARKGDTSGVDWETEGAPPGWSIWRRNPGEGKMSWVSAADGKHVVLAAVKGACFLQTVPVTPGSMYLALADCRGKGSEGSKASLAFSWKDAKGGWIDTSKRMSDLKPEIADTWRTVGMAGRAPTNAAVAVVMLFADDQTDADSLAFDNVRMFVVPKKP